MIGRNDTAGAVKWFKQAAKLGEPRGFCAMAKFYATGHGVEFSLPKALSLALQAAAKGSDEAHHLLATILESASDPSDPGAALSADSAHCLHCGAVGSATLKLSLCSACRDAYFCGVECQRCAWKAHKGACKRAQEKGAPSMVILPRPPSTPGFGPPTHFA